MILHRISTKKYARDLSGTGSKLYGGRWNPKGSAMLYTAEHKSLSALELLAHIDKSSIPDDLEMISIEVPDDCVLEFPITLFKSILKNENSKSKFREEGKNWLISDKSLGLKVPSVVIPSEKNVLLNPSHKLFSKIKIVKVESFYYDERLFK